MRDPMNGKMYIMQAIAWFVKKGEPVSVDTPIMHNFVKKMAPGDPRDAFPTSVVESSLEACQLPDQMTSDTRLLCSILSNLSPVSESTFIERNKRIWSLGKHHLSVEYQVRVVICPADIRFELWYDNQKMSEDISISVDWVPASPGLAPDIAVHGREELEARTPAMMSGGRGNGNWSGGEGNGHKTERKGGTEKREWRGRRIAGRILERAKGGEWPVYG